MAPLFALGDTDKMTNLSGATQRMAGEFDKQIREKIAKSSRRTLSEK